MKRRKPVEMVDLTVRVEADLIVRLDATAVALSNVGPFTRTRGEVTRGAILFGLDLLDKKIKRLAAQPHAEPADYKWFRAVWRELDRYDALPSRKAGAA